MKDNVKKRAPSEHQEQMLKDITYLQESVSEAEFIERKNVVLYKWTSEGLHSFVEYFTKQWLSPPFDKWQLFNTPPGYSTCNPCEPFNAEIKKTYTVYKKDIFCKP